MQKLSVFSFFICLLLASCATMQSSTTIDKDKAILNGYTVTNTSGLTDPVNYFVMKRQREFNNVFGIGTSPTTEADFSEDFVLAIVGKPSTKEMNITILRTEISGDDLNVHYDINYTWNELPMSATPSVLMSVSKDLDIETVNFYSQNTLRKSIRL